MTLASDGSFTYTPAANYNGSDSFTYTASDGDGGLEHRDGDGHGHGGQRRAGGGRRQRRRRRKRRRSAVAVLTNDTDVDGATTLTATLVTSPRTARVTLASDGSFTYTPAANYNGPDSFTYTANDGTAVSNIATVTITVTAVNDAPVAVDDSGDDGGRDARSAARC